MGENDCLLGSFEAVDPQPALEPLDQWARHNLLVPQGYLTREHGFDEMKEFAAYYPGVYPPQRRYGWRSEARRSAEPGEADLRMTYRDRQKLQVALTSRGFDVGGIDGTFGSRSRQMIAAWQTKNGDISTSFFTAAQKKTLLNEAAPAIAKWEDEQRRAYAEEQRRLQQLQQQQPSPSQRRSGWKWPWQ